MKNPFSPADQGEMNLKRNAYDLSNSSIFSTEFGRLTPSFLQEVIPGDSFQIDGSLAIQGMPTVFPLQTRCRASVEFYYCRNRCVHDHFEDFIFQTKDIEQPWLRMNIERAKQMISTGSLGDMFGLPTTYVSDSSILQPLLSSYPSFIFGNSSVFSMVKNKANAMSLINGYKEAGTPLNFTSFDNWSYYFCIGFYSDLYSFPLNNLVNNSLIISEPIRTSVSVSEIPLTDTNIFVVFLDENNVPITDCIDCSLQYNLDTSKVFIESTNDINFYDLTSNILESYDSYKLFVGYASPHSDNTSLVNRFSYFIGGGYTFNSGESTYDLADLVFPSSFISYFNSGSSIIDATDDTVISANPFVGTTPSIKVNALPFRHYEMICNYYYRNDKNNPYYLNGVPQYNEFIPTHADGADDNVYDYHYRNWELDRFTSAVQSPQFGEAPLVGLTFNGADTAQLTFQDANDATKTYTATVGLDGDRVATVEDFSTDIPSANLRKLTDGISYGISINDLRVTNSFQRFLENTLRRGLRYRNQLKSHFGVSVDYPDIDIPQYIGGFSGELTVGKNTQMASTSEAPLGDFNGSLSGLLQSKHKIHCYCPEHGYIIGIVSISPMPVYTQVANKSLIKYSPFDYYLPEFGKIGFVPIHYSEVMPLQTPDGGSVDDVFGYQKAHYDYMQNFDSAHGFFRTNLKDFLLQRVFKERPDLVSDFTVINPDQLTDVFVTRNIDDGYNMRDKFLCNLHVTCIAKRVIPRVGTPSLE